VRHLKAALPPSFESRASNHNDSAKIEYVLKVKVRGPGRFHCSQSIQQKLLFLSLDPPVSSIPLGLGATTSSPINDFYTLYDLDGAWKHFENAEAVHRYRLPPSRESLLVEFKDAMLAIN
jgi:hypothetical protein